MGSVHGIPALGFVVDHLRYAGAVFVLGRGWRQDGGQVLMLHGAVTVGDADTDDGKQLLVSAVLVPTSLE